MTKPAFRTTAALAWLLSGGAALAAPPADAASPLAGAWVLTAADVIRADGRRERDYGAAPKGLLMIDGAGRYSLQIFKAERPRFASGDRAKGTPAEYEAAVLGSSTHYGMVSIDPAARALVFEVEAASFPNQDGTVQKRPYELVGDELSYRVPPRPNGDVPISVWRRVPANVK